MRSSSGAVDALPLFPDLGDVVAHYARRTGGVSRPPFHSLNLGFSTGDDRDHVRENRRRLAAATGTELGRWVVAGQVHGIRVLTVTRDIVGRGATEPSPRLAGHDVVVLPEPGSFALVLGADCPAVIAVDETRRTAAVAHAGWRGTAAGAVPTLIDALVARGSVPSELDVAITPGIGGCCYEVGSDVIRALDDACPSGHTLAGEADEPTHVDLRQILVEQLADRGVSRARIRTNTECVACDAERYFSYRRDRGTTGRNGVLVGWRT